jgi:hypothetical protein
MVQPRVARQSHDILDPLSLQDVQPVVAGEATIDTDPGLSARECPTLMRQFGFPTLLCNQLEIDSTRRIVNYHMRMPNQKKTLGGRIQITQLSCPRCRRCLQRHRHAWRGPCGILLLPARSPPQRVSTVSGNEDVRRAASAFRRGGEFQIASIWRLTTY